VVRRSRPEKGAFNLRKPKFTFTPRALRLKMPLTFELFGQFTPGMVIHRLASGVLHVADFYAATITYFKGKTGCHR